MGRILLFSTLFMLAIVSCKKDKPIPDGTMGTVTDVDGNVYKTVIIGDQWWMAENLKTTRLNDSKSILNVELDGAWSNPQFTDPMMCYYNNDIAYEDKCGVIYNWYAANNSKLAPAGWHVATWGDWETLQNYLIASGYNFDGSTSENKIGKSLASISGWTNDPTLGNVGNDQSSNNKTGLNILPVGARASNGTFYLNEGAQRIWTSTSNYLGEGVEYVLFSDKSWLGTSFSSKREGKPIRCVKD